MAKLEVKPPFVRSAYNYDRDQVSDETGLKCEDPSRAKQEFKEECDINTIVERFGIGYEMPEGLKAPTYGDFSDVVDFHSAMSVVRGAAETFMQLSADVRSRFSNDAGKFVDFCSNPDNREELERLGLAVPRIITDARGVVLEPTAAPKGSATVDPGPAPAAAPKA